MFVQPASELLVPNPGSLAHKMREAMASEVRTQPIGGVGKRAEIDGGYFGGYIKPANRVENRRDRRLRQHQSGKRKAFQFRFQKSADPDSPFFFSFSDGHARRLRQNHREPSIPPTARIAGMYNSIAPDTDAIWRRPRIRSPVHPGIFSGESIFRIV
jgi:hypothetical protein